MTSPKDFWTKHSIKQSDIEHPDHALEMEQAPERSGIDVLRSSPASRVNSYFASRYGGLVSGSGLRVGQVLPSWSPLKLNLAAWYNPTLLPFSVGDRIKVINDLSGNNRHALATAFPPFLKIVGGRRYAQFDTNTGSGLAAVDYGLTQPFTLSFAFNCASDTASDALFLLGIFPNYVQTNGTGTNIVAKLGGGVSANFTVVANVNYIVTLKANGAGSTITVNRAFASGSGNIGAANPGHIDFGDPAGGAGAMKPNNMGEVVVANGIINAQETIDLENYLARNWGAILV